MVITGRGKGGGQGEIDQQVLVTVRKNKFWSVVQ